MDQRRAVQIQYFCSEPSSCHSRANWVSGVAMCSNFFKSSWHSLPRCFSCWAQRVPSLGSKFLCGPKADWSTPITAEKPTLEVRRRIILTKSPYGVIVASSKCANSFAALQRIFGYVYIASIALRSRCLTFKAVRWCCFVIAVKGNGALLQLARIFFAIY